MTGPDLPTIRATGDSARFGLDGYDETTYGDAFADIYDEWYDDLGDDDFIDAVATVLPGDSARVLELGVGTGRLLEALRTLRPGARDTMVGIDSSAAMLDRARARLGNAIELVRGDFSSVMPAGPFDAVFIGYNTLFNLPDEDALSACLRLVADRLSIGGAFMVDATCPTTNDPPAPDDNTVSDHVGIRSMRNGEIVLTATRHDPVERRIVGQFVSYADGERMRVRSWAVRYWPTEELDRIAESAGLVLVTRSTGNSGRTDADGGNRHISHYTARTGNLDAQ